MRGSTGKAEVEDVEGRRLRNTSLLELLELYRPLGPLGFNFSQHGPTTRPSRHKKWGPEAGAHPRKKSPLHKSIILKCQLLVACHLAFDQNGLKVVFCDQVGSLFGIIRLGQYSRRRTIELFLTCCNVYRPVTLGSGQDCLWWGAQACAGGLRSAGGLRW